MSARLPEMMSFASPRQQANGDAAGHGPLTLLLSLTLILLALFILLGAAVRQDGGAAGPAQAPQGSGNGTLELVSPVDDLQRAVRGSVVSRLQMVTPDMTLEAGGMRLVLPVAQLFEVGGGLRPSGRAWLGDIGHLLRGVGKGWYGQMTVQGRDVAQLAYQVVTLNEALGAEQTQVVVAYEVPKNVTPAEQIILVLTAPAGVVKGQDVERLQQGLERSGMPVRGVPLSSPDADRYGVNHD